MKICDVTQFYSPVSGGVKRYVQEKRRYVNTHTADEHVLIIPGDETATRIEGRCRIHTIRSPLVDRTSRYRFLWNIKALRLALDEEQPDVIECGDPYHVAWAVLSWAQRNDVPVAGFYHSHFPDAYLRTLDRFVGKTARDFVQEIARDYIRRLYSRFDITFVPSPHLAELLRGWGVENATSVRLGVDADTFRPGPREASVREELQIPADRVLLLNVGRLAGEKNVVPLLDAFRELVARHPGRYHLLMVGDGPLRPEVQRAAADTGAVTWRSYYDDSSELARVYRAADLMVHPGVNETFGLVTVEAQACGLPVVAYRGTFMDRLAFCGQEHWAAERTPHALANAVEAFAERDREPLSRQVAEQAAAYAWPKVFGELFERYRSLV